MSLCPCWGAWAAVRLTSFRSTHLNHLWPFLFYHLVRTDPPIHGFCILNREGAGNFVQPLRRGDEMEVTDDYIIYRPVDVGLGESV